MFSFCFTGLISAAIQA